MGRVGLAPVELDDNAPTMSGSGIKGQADTVSGGEAPLNGGQHEMCCPICGLLPALVQQGILQANPRWRRTGVQERAG
jgi:hypothetical protein